MSVIPTIGCQVSFQSPTSSAKRVRDHLRSSHPGICSFDQSTTPSPPQETVLYPELLTNEPRCIGIGLVGQAGLDSNVFNDSYWSRRVSLCRNGGRDLTCSWESIMPNGIKPDEVVYPLPIFNVEWCFSF